MTTIRASKMNAARLRAQVHSLSGLPVAQTKDDRWLPTK